MAEPAAPPVCYRHTDRETYIACQRCERPICPDCMVPAAVGFQCPDCLKEGKKSTRSGRTAYGGERSADSARTSQALIGVNVLFWLLIVATGWHGSEWVDKLALVPEYLVGCTGPASCFVVQDGVAHGAVWQLVTSMFLHVDLWHIGFNMMALWVLGPQLELALGRSRFLALYLLSGLTGSAMVYCFSHPNGATLGASGAIFGLMGALAVIAHKVGGDLRSILTWVGANFVITFLIPNISWQGHLGGFLGGSALAALLIYAPRDRRNLVQWGGMAAYAVVLVGVIVARTLVLRG